MSKHRFYLFRHIDDVFCSDTTLGWILFNPSTADENMDDPTIRRVQTFTKIAGHRKLWLMNLIPRRATNPEDLRGLTYEQAFQSKEDSPIADLASTLEKPEAIVCAWGALVSDPHIHDLARTGILNMYKAVTKAWPNMKFKCLGRTSGTGHPRHPLYIKSDHALETFDFHRYVNRVSDG